MRRKITVEKTPIYHLNNEGTEMVVGYSYYLRNKLHTKFFETPITKEKWEGKA